MRYSHPLFVIALVFMSAMVLTTSPANAQEQARAESVDEIIVSARKRDENLQDVPTAVTAITDEAIADLNILSINDIARYTPGFSFSQAFGRTTERPVVRGAGNILAGVQYGVESGTAYFINGQYYSGDLAALDLNQVARVEVVKGPQSALYGRNSYAGAVNFIMLEPSEERSGRVSVSIAQHDQYELYANVSGSMSETVSGNLSVRHYEYGGELTNALDNQVIGDQESFNVSGSLRILMSDAATLKLRLGYTEDDDGPRSFALYKSNENNCYPGYRSNAYRAGPDTNPNQYYCGVVPPADQATQNLDGTPFIGIDREMINFSAVLDVDTANDHLVSVKLSYLDEERTTGADSDHQIGSFPIGHFFGGNRAFLNFTDVDEIQDYSAEVSILSPQESRFRYLAGLFIYDYERDQSGLYLELPTRLNSTNEITNQAAFAAVEFDFTDRLTGSVEARWAEDEKTLTERASGTGTETSPLMYADPVSATFDGVTPRVVVNYQAQDDMMLYASFAQGTKPGGLNGANGINAGRPEYEEEEVDAFEFGAKTAWLDGRVVANLSAYHNEITQYQLTTPVENVAGGSVTSIATNQGDVEVEGVELELRTFPAENVTFGMTYAWTDATFTRGCDDFQFTLTSGGFQMAPFDINDRSTWNRYRVSNDGGATPANDPDGRYAAGKGNCSIEGHQVPMTSEHQMSAYINMNFPMNNGMDFFINSDVTYESSKFVQVHNGMETGSTVLVGMSAGVKSEEWSLRFFGVNLTNEDSIVIGTRWFDVLQGSNAIPFASRGGIDTGSPRANLRSLRDRGRQLGVKLTRHF